MMPTFAGSFAGSLLGDSGATRDLFGAGGAAGADVDADVDAPPPPRVTNWAAREKRSIGLQTT